MHASLCDLSEFGLVKVNFEMPMYAVSGLQVGAGSGVWSIGVTFRV
jgi:hypothetical protein